MEPKPYFLDQDTLVLLLQSLGGLVPGHWMNSPGVNPLVGSLSLLSKGNPWLNSFRVDAIL